MPTPLADILYELDLLLEPNRFQDYCPNGLQVPGAAQVSTVATGVSAHLELFERAREEQAELILAHHGIFWGNGPQALDAIQARRLKLLLGADISLAAYHLPLDAHPEVGNNALIARALGAESLERFAEHHGQALGVVGLLPGDGLAAGELVARVHTLTAREPLVFDYGPEQISRVAVVSGAAADHLDDAFAVGAEAFITGEPAERVMARARELGMHFIAAGHYATETFGIKRLGEHLSERFGLRHVFIDVPNPI